MRWIATLWGLLLTAAVAASPAHAQEPASDVTSVSAAATYVVDPVGGRIDASVRVTVTNLELSGGRSVDAVSILLPTAAGGLVTATRSGAQMEVVAGPIAGDFQLFSLGLGRAVGPGGRAELDVRFSMLQLSSDREVSATRINEAYVSFPARGVGDSARGSVRVVLPNWFEARWVGTGAIDVEPVSSVQGLARVFETVGVGADFVAIVEARHDDSLDRRAVDVRGVPGGVEVASWPGDAIWRASVEQDVARLLPRLSELVGEPWPLTGALVIRETNAGLVHGYGGAFVRTATGGGEIELGPTYSDRVLAHELAHAWFDERLDPWLAEGLAEEFARQVASSPGNDAVARREDAVAVPLEEWIPLTGDLELDRYAYAAAGAMMQSVADDLGPDAVRTAVRGLLDSTSAYASELPTGAGLVDWQRFLDAVDEAGETDVEEALVEWVLSAPGPETLDRRRTTRDALDVFEGRAAAWGVPLAIPLAMTNWDFDRADEALGAANGLLDERDRLATRSAELGVTGPTDARDVFAVDPVTAATLLLSQSEGLDAVERAQALGVDDRSWMQAVGLWGDQVDSRVDRVVAAYEEGDHTFAIAEAGELGLLIEDAERTGQQRIAGAVSIVALIGLALVLVRLRRRFGAHSLRT